MQSVKRKNILDFDIFNGNKKQLTAYLDFKISQTNSAVCLFYANSNLLQNCYRAADVFSKEYIVIANDGIALDSAAFMLTGSSFAENLNGTDFTPYFLQSSRYCKRVFLLGGRPGVAEKASANLESRYGVNVVGWANGYQDMENTQELIQHINALQPDAILVALGNPKQEEWILEYKDSLNTRLIVGVGALLDFLSGSVSRAPLWMQRSHIEWLYRLCGEPRRLVRRYTVEMFLFFVVCLKWRFSSGHRLK